MNRLRYGLLALFVAAGVVVGGCGDETTTTVTETTPASSTTSSTTSTAESTTTESASTTSSPDQEEPTAGETADLPLCSEGPAPCRDDSTGAVIEPGEESDGGGVVAP